MNQNDLAIDSRQLKNPPLKEMTFSVVLQMPALGLDRIREIVSNVDAEMEETCQLMRQRVRFNMEMGGDGGETQAQVRGLRFHRGTNLFLTVENGMDKQHVIFSYSILPPYTSWMQFTDLALAAYKKFIDSIAPTVIKRVAVRTVDEVQTKKLEGGISLREILKTAPAGVAGLPAGRIDEFFFRDSVYYAQFDVHATTVRTFKPTAAGKLPNLILDTDVFHMGVVPTSDSTAMSNILEHIHYVRNQLFFGSIGEKMLEDGDE